MLSPDATPFFPSGSGRPKSLRWRDSPPSPDRELQEMRAPVREAAEEHACGCAPEQRPESELPARRAPAPKLSGELPPHWKAGRSSYRDVAARNTGGSSGEQRQPRQLASSPQQPTRIRLRSEIHRVSEAAPDADGWRVVRSKRSRRRQTAPRRPLSTGQSSRGHSQAAERSAPPSDFKGRCFNCLSEKHKVADCRLPTRCLRCKQFWHHARDCKRPRQSSRRPSGQQAGHRQHQGQHEVGLHVSSQSMLDKQQQARLHGRGSSSIFGAAIAAISPRRSDEAASSPERPPERRKRWPEMQAFKKVGQVSSNPRIQCKAVKEPQCHTLVPQLHMTESIPRQLPRRKQVPNDNCADIQCVARHQPAVREVDPMLFEALAVEYPHSSTAFMALGAEHGQLGGSTRPMEETLIHVGSAQHDHLSGPQLETPPWEDGPAGSPAQVDDQTAQQAQSAMPAIASSRPDRPEEDAHEASLHHFIQACQTPLNQPIVAAEGSKRRAPVRRPRPQSNPNPGTLPRRSRRLAKKEKVLPQNSVKRAQRRIMEKLGLVKKDEIPSPEASSAFDQLFKKPLSQKHIIALAELFTKGAMGKVVEAELLASHSQQLAGA